MEVLIYLLLCLCAVNALNTSAATSRLEDPMQTSDTFLMPITEMLKPKIGTLIKVLQVVNGEDSKKEEKPKEEWDPKIQKEVMKALSKIADESAKKEKWWSESLTQQEPRTMMVEVKTEQVPAEQTLKMRVMRPKGGSRYERELPRRSRQMEHDTVMENESDKEDEAYRRSPYPQREKLERLNYPLTREDPDESAEIQNGVLLEVPVVRGGDPQRYQDQRYNFNPSNEDRYEHNVEKLRHERLIIPEQQAHRYPQHEQTQIKRIREEVNHVERPYMMKQQVRFDTPNKQEWTTIDHVVPLRKDVDNGQIRTEGAAHVDQMEEKATDRGRNTRQVVDAERLKLKDIMMTNVKENVHRQQINPRAVRSQNLAAHPAVHQWWPEKPLLGWPHQPHSVQWGWPHALNYDHTSTLHHWNTNAWLWPGKVWKPHPWVHTNHFHGWKHNAWWPPVAHGWKADPWKPIPWKPLPEWTPPKWPSETPAPEATTAAAAPSAEQEATTTVPVSEAPLPPVESPKEEQEWEDRQPYAFGYKIFDKDGKQTREEHADGNGNVKGHYTIDLPDGRKRVVKYTAGAEGFKAKVESNEPGTLTQASANVETSITPKK